MPRQADAVAAQAAQRAEAAQAARDREAREAALARAAAHAAALEARARRAEAAKVPPRALSSERDSPARRRRACTCASQACSVPADWTAGTTAF